MEMIFEPVDIGKKILKKGWGGASQEDSQG
jgi:hypothetical protein